MQQLLDRLKQTVQEDAFEAPLLCVSRREETPDSATLVFEAGNQALFHYYPGQFITLLPEIDGQTVARAYSLSSSPSRPFTLECTIKRVPDGLVSNWLLDNIYPGNKLKSLPPAGEFSLQKSAQPERYLFLSAGSGITPLLSMSRWLLDTGSHSQIDFVHSAPDARHTIFLSRLQMMARSYSNFNLYMLHDAVQKQSTEFAISQMFSEDWFNAQFSALENTEVYTCGPEGYMQLAERILRQRQFPMTHFYKESFQPAIQEKPESEESSMSDVVIENASAPSTSVQQFEIDVAGEKILLNKGQTLLEGIEGSGQMIMAACRAGVCGSCKCQVTEGETESSSQQTLQPEEIEQGFVLACSTSMLSDGKVSLP